MRHATCPLPTMVPMAGLARPAPWSLASDGAAPEDGVNDALGEVGVQDSTEHEPKCTGSCPLNSVIPHARPKCPPCFGAMDNVVDAG